MPTTTYPAPAPTEVAASQGGRLRRALAATPVLARRAALFEAGMWRSLARWIARRPSIPPGGTPFRYRGPLMPPLLAFFFVSALEAVVLDVILANVGAWTWVRVSLLVVGIWGAVLMLGMLAAVIVHPHVVGPSGLWVRYSASLDVHIPWDAVARVRETRGGRDGRSVQVDDDTLHVLVMNQSTVAITLSRPLVVALSPDREAEISALHLYADDAAALVTAVRARIDAEA